MVSVSLVVVMYLVLKEPEEHDALVQNDFHLLF